MDVIINFSFILIVLLLGYHAHGQNELTPPEIFPEGDDYLINATQTFTLRCSGKNFVTWTAPDNGVADSAEEASPIYSNITIESSTTPDSKYPYGSVLTIWNASFLDVGYYYCHENTTDFNDLSRVSRIYIYVYDINTLSVIPQLQYAITAVEHSDAVLPCRPTSPDVKVELRQTTGEEDLIGKVPLDIQDASGTFVTYNPKEGYTVHKATTDDSMLYSCTFFRGDDFFDLFVLLIVEQIPYSIAKPLLEEVSDGHTIVGQNLMLKCTLRYIEPFVMDWIVPNKNGIQSGQINISKSTKTQNDDEYFQNLEIENTTLADQGEYTCIVRSTQHVNNDTKFIKVYDHMEHFINLTEQNNIYIVSIKTHTFDVQWFIDVNAHPIPKLIWYNNKDKEIQTLTATQSNDNLKYVIDIESGKYAFLKINDVTIFDRGYYKLKAINDFEEKTLILFLNVTDKPSVDIQMKNFHKIREPSIIRCKVTAYPEATINWFYKPCLYRGCNYTHVLSTRVETNGLLQTAYLNITANHTGYLLCTANNSLGSDEVSKGFFVTDVKNGFGIWGLDEDTIETENNITRYPVAVGDDLIIYCAASHYNYTSDLKWYKQVSGDTILIESDNHYNIEKGSTEYSNKVTLTIPNVSYNDSGKYLCVVENKTNFDVRVNDTVIIAVRDPEMPAFILTNLNNTDLVIMSLARLELICKARGIPKPAITWYKNGEEMLEILPKNRIEMAQNNQIMIFKHTDFGDEGTYTCKASNKIGSVQREIRLKLKPQLGDKPAEFDYVIISLIVAVIIIFIVAIALGILLKLKFNKKKKLRRELKMAGLHCFQFGNLKRFNPELGIDSQAELLPYNNNYEFPRDKLELGQQLGSGAFGVVLKADAFGIISNEEKTTVAVKTVKSIADDIHMKALVSELKIMIHLGQHLNVVNLLGACTQNIIKRELLVIVEYCQFGNLYNYLLQNRSNFIDQIDSVTANIDYYFDLEHIESVPAVYKNASIPQEAELNNISSLNKNDKLFYTKDLISWSFQIARGMEYLASRKIFHGDLAARNILLAENNIVKICDFGLAKRIYRTDNYKKNKDCPLPFKWMAIESIRDLVFSTQSDVWSYGIVLWELFSLAQTPYPGMEPDEQLYQKLLEGYRMESPSYAPKEIYKIMCDCFNSDPLSRPCFNKLAGTVGLLLEENIRQFYIDLNDPYFVMNTTRLAEDQNDFLVMLSAPNATETPKYLSVKPSDLDENIADNKPNMNINYDHTK